MIRRAVITLALAVVLASAAANADPRGVAIPPQPLTPEEAEAKCVRSVKDMDPRSYP